MDEALLGVWKNMRELGLGSLAHANRHSAYYSMENVRWSELSVLQAAHAAELLIKARIAQEHPLLIFEKIPGSMQTAGSKLDFEDLFVNGRTIQWNNLPDRLWAVAGIELPKIQKFRAFGNLRNGIQHFGPSDNFDAGAETLHFIYDVIDPFINMCWGLFAIDYDEDYDPYVYLTSTLADHQILFLVSPEAAKQFDYWEIEWDDLDEDYSLEIKNSVMAAQKKNMSVEVKKI